MANKFIPHKCTGKIQADLELRKENTVYVVSGKIILRPSKKTENKQANTCFKKNNVFKINRTTNVVSLINKKVSTYLKTYKYLRFFY